ncbi:MAG: amidohydrolase family protein [Terriglobia bacterium]
MAPKPLIIDSNVQIGTGESWFQPRKPADYKLEDVLPRATEAGIDRLCVMAPFNLWYKERNKEVARLCEKHPETLIGFAVHSPQRETGKLRAMLTEEVRSMGLKAVKSDGHPTREFLDPVAELEIPVIYYPAGEGSLYENYYMMATAYPSVNFIIPHLASYASGDWTLHFACADLLRRFPNVYAETSSVIYHKYLAVAVGELPAEKFIFGSFAPDLDPRVEMYCVKLLNLPEPEKAKILGGNMQRLLGL